MGYTTAATRCTGAQWAKLLALEKGGGTVQSGVGYYVDLDRGCTVTLHTRAQWAKLLALEKGGGTIQSGVDYYVDLDSGCTVTLHSGLDY